MLIPEPTPAAGTAEPHLARPGNGLLICAATSLEVALLPPGTPGARVVRLGLRPDYQERLRPHFSPRPGALLSFGFAAGLAPELAPGALLLPHTVRNLSGRAFAVTTAWRASVAAALGSRATVESGDIIQHNHVVSTLAGKRALHAATGAVALDMESAALAEIAARAGMRFLVLRVVVDAAYEVMPPALVQILTPDGRLHAARMVLALTRAPFTLWRLATAYRRAATTLRTAVHGAWRDLALGDLSARD